MPDEFCWFERMQAIVKDHEEREMQIYSELREELKRFHSELAAEQKEIADKLSHLQSQFDRSYVILAIIKYLAPIGAVLAGVVWWMKDHIK